MNNQKRKYEDYKEKQPKFWFELCKMNTFTIPFGNTNAERIGDIGLKIHYTNIFQSLWKEKMNGFPGTLAKSCLKSDFEFIVKNDWYLFPKTNGVRYYF